MKEDTKYILVAVGAAVAVVAILFSSLFLYSGVWPPFSVVESGSMQHSDESSLDTIDTGDMVVVRDPSGIDIVSYVEGYKTGYSKFGEYGDVIVYERTSKNPVIHRAIVWLDWNDITKKWDAPSLDGFPGWYDSTGNDSNNSNGIGLSGTLTFTDIGFSKKTVYLDLDKLSSSSVIVSGYATMGDSVGNWTFDQTGGIIGSLVSNDMIIYVAGFEIPWIGCIKLYLTDTNINQIPPNSIPSMVFAGVSIIMGFITLFVIIDYTEWYKEHTAAERKRRKIWRFVKRLG